MIQVERSDSARSCDSLGSVPAAAAGSLLMFVYNGQSLAGVCRRKSCFVRYLEFSVKRLLQTCADLSSLFRSIEISNFASDEMCALVSLSSNSIATELSTVTLRVLRVVTYGLLLAYGTTNVASAAPVNIRVFSAIVNFSYVDPVSRTELMGADVGRFGVASRLKPESGVVVHVRSDDGLNHGCGLPVNIPHGNRKWIALVRRGDCKFNEKIHNAAVMANASAVVVYNHRDEETLITMQHLGE